MTAADLIAAIETSAARAHKAEPRPENIAARARCFISALSGSLFHLDADLAESVFLLISQQETDEPK